MERPAPQSQGRGLRCDSERTVAQGHMRNGPGCDPSRPAVAHRLGGQRLARQPAHPPIPCLTVVGQTSESAAVGVTRSGAVLYAPLLQNSAAPPTNVLQGPEFVVRSNDRGATWTTLDSGGPTTGGLVPPWMSVDPHASRIWFAIVARGTLPTTVPGLARLRDEHRLPQGTPVALETGPRAHRSQPARGQGGLFPLTE